MRRNIRKISLRISQIFLLNNDRSSLEILSRNKHFLHSTQRFVVPRSVVFVASLIKDRCNIYFLEKSGCKISWVLQRKPEKKRKFSRVCATATLIVNLRNIAKRLIKKFRTRNKTSSLILRNKEKPVERILFWSRRQKEEIFLHLLSLSEQINKSEANLKKQTQKRRKEITSSVPIADTTKRIMSTMKPDYFIAHNGLPNIMLTRGRRLITKTTTSTIEADRMSNNQQQIHPLPNKNNRLVVMNQQAHVMQRDSEKNVKNRAIKESLRNTKSSKDLINAQIVKNSSSWNKRGQQTQVLSNTKCANIDNSNDCNRKLKR